MMKRIAPVLALLLCAGCIMPIPHRRLHAYGVKGQIVNASDQRPIADALVTCNVQKKRDAKTDTTGQFTLRPAYGWHGAYVIGPINLSLLPGWDMTYPGSTFEVFAPGFQRRNLLRVRWPCSRRAILKCRRSWFDTK